MEIDFIHLNIVVGTVIPILVGLLAKLTASSALKAVLNAGLSAVGGWLTAALATCDQGTVCALGGREAVLAVGVTWVTSVATYYGLWKPTGTAGAVQDSTASFGLGGGSHGSTT